MPLTSHRLRTRTIYTGRVQGVGFRASTHALAQRFPITGFVRNEPDGSVLCEAQGSAADLERFHSSLREHLARFIKNETSSAIPPLLGEPDFTIQR